VERDYPERHNLAVKPRGKLIEMIGRWWAEAGKYNVLPPDGNVRSRLCVERPTIARPRDKIVYCLDGSSVPFPATRSSGR
jgi:arylsulfatase